MTPLLWGLFVVGCLIIATLGFYAGTLLYKLKLQRDSQETAAKERIEYIESSIQTIAFAMESEQCELSEGAIRISVLLENLAMLLSKDTSYEQDYPALFGLYGKIKHMPTHEARKLFDKREIRAMDKERLGYEKDFRDDIRAELERLKPFSAH